MVVAVAALDLLVSEETVVQSVCAVGFIACILAGGWLGSCLEAGDERRDAQRAVYRAERVAFCEQICANEHQHLYAVGRSPGEWRCFCSDGYWQPIP